MNNSNNVYQFPGKEISEEERIKDIKRRERKLRAILRKDIKDNEKNNIVRTFSDIICQSQVDKLIRTKYRREDNGEPIYYFYRLENIGSLSDFEEIFQYELEDCLKTTKAVENK